LHNSNQLHTVQLDLSGNSKNPNLIFCGIFSLDEIKACNTLRDDRSWVFYLKKLPVRNPDDDYRICRELKDANSGVPLSEQCFSEPPNFGEEITKRAIKVGVQVLTVNTKSNFLSN